MPKVLLIDDEEGIRESLSIMLQIEGFETVALPDAVKALQLIDSGPYFDFIISDIKMPHMDGIEFLREVRKRELDSIVIMITAYGNIETPIDAIKSGGRIRPQRPRIRRRQQHGILCRNQAPGHLSVGRTEVGDAQRGHDAARQTGVRAVGRDQFREVL